VVAPVLLPLEVASELLVADVPVAEAPVCMSEAEVPVCVFEAEIPLCVFEADETLGPAVNKAE